MADFNQPRPVSTYNAHQDEFGFKEGDGQDSFQDAPDRMTGYGDTDAGVGGPKSGYGTSKEGAAFDHATSEQTQFGLEGKSGYGHEGSDPHLGATDTRAYAAVDPSESKYDNTPRSNTETVPAGNDWSREDTSRTHGEKKDGLVDKIKEKLPGQQHHTAAGGTATATATEDPPKKGMMEKIKEKMPGHH